MNEKIKYSIPGIILFAAIVLIGGYLYNQKNSPLANNIRKTILHKSATDFTSLKVVPVKDAAFGTLSVATTTAPASNTMGSAPMATGLGGGAPASDKMIAPGMPIRAQAYKYVYNGESVDLTETKLDVLKKIKGTLQNTDAADSLKNYNFGSINLNSFANSKLDNFSVSQNEDFGYVISVSFPEDSISIYQNWHKWMSQACIQGGCNPQPLEPGDVPDQQTILGIVQGFIEDHGINTDPYGAPFVQDYSRVIYYLDAKPNAQTNFYIPDQMQVLYPLMIDDKTVFDASGNPTGLSISVDLRNKRVAGLWQLTSHTYQASAYDAETDFTKIKSIAEKGGMYGYDGGYDKNTNITTLELEKPTLQWMQYWMSTDNGYTQSELYVPALVFAIKDPPQDIYQKNIVVPLIKDVLNAGSSSKIVPMSGSGSSGSATTPPPVKY